MGYFGANKVFRELETDPITTHHATSDLVLGCQWEQRKAISLWHHLLKAFDKFVMY